MCGITGAVWPADDEPISETTLRQMTDVLAHRGPDDSGLYFSPADNGGPRAALGHRRLSIIDLAGGHQPLSNEEGTVWIAFNGEIYNYRELRADLISAGHRFATEADTETIVHAYEEYGEDCVSHFRGMFAFAIWDENRKRLLLARDRLGQKPLFYRVDEERIAFASELKSLLQIPGAPRELNSQAIDLYFTYQYVPHPYCILDGYAKLPPAHIAVFENGRLDVKQYWSPPYQDWESTRTWTAEKWRTELRETLTEAVRLRMRSDVPLGAFLSGGIDSTIIAGLMQSMSDRPVHTFSIGFPIKQFDEREYARAAAEHLGTEHHEYVVEPSAVDILPKLIWQYDEPFGDNSAIPTMYLSEKTRQTVTVALSGDGGDELFAGYDRYRAAYMAGWFDRLPKPLRKFLTAPIWQKIPASVEQKSFRRRAKRFLAALAQPPERRYLRWIGIFNDEMRSALYTQEFRDDLNGYDAAGFLLDAYSGCPERDFITRTTRADVLSYLPCDILTKVDIASMSYSLECRSPFLDHRVAELAARMPIELKHSSRKGKLILVETFRDLLPESIQNRKKMGFGVPLDHWLRGELNELLRDTLLAENCVNRGYLDPVTVERLIVEHETRRVDHSYRLWTLLCFETWCRTFLDVPAPITA